MLQIRPNEALEAAVTASGFLANWMKEPDLASLELIERTFGILAGLIEAFPPTVISLDTMCYLRNHVNSSRLLFNAGEWGAAGYQLLQIYRKLTSSAI
jgi:hypothetical protein